MINFRSFISKTSGLIMIIIDLLFAIWAGFGRAWYIYLINFALLWLVSGIINTSYIEGLTRGMSYISLYGRKGIFRAFMLNILTFIFIFIGYIITRFVFLYNIQYILFFGSCIVVSTVVAVIDNRFTIALEKTKLFENMQENNTNDNDILSDIESTLEGGDDESELLFDDDEYTPVSPLEMIRRMKDIPSILEWSKGKHLTILGPEFWGVHYIYIDDTLNHVILLPKKDLTTHVFIGSPTKAKEWRKYDKNGNLLLSKNLEEKDLEWKIYKDVVLYKGEILPPKKHPERPYWGKIIDIETFYNDITDRWIINTIINLHRR